jgi:signal transduction histidine kinase
MANESKIIKDITRQIKTEFRQRETELEVLRELDQRLLREDVSLEATCNFIVESILRLLKADAAGLLLRRHKLLDLVALRPQGRTPTPLDLKDSVTGWCVLQGRSARIGNVRTDKRFHHLYKEFQGDKGRRMISELAAPIIFNGTAIGVLNVESPKENAFDEHHQRLLETLAGQASLAFKKVRLFDEAEVFAALRPHLLSDSPRTDVAIWTILSKALSALNTYLGDLKHFQILFREEDRLVVAYSSSGKDINVRVNIADCVSGEAVIKRSPILVTDVSSHPKYIRMLGDSIKSEMVVPIEVQNVVTGVLNFESDDPDIFDDYSKVIVQHFSAQMAWLLTLLSLRFELSARMRSDRANTILQAMGDRTGNLVHRLKNVVGPIKLQAEELQLHHQKELAANPDVAGLIESIRKRAEEALTIPSQMRKMFVELEYVDVNAVIADIVQQFACLRGILVATDMSKDLPKVRCQGLGAVLHTLLENAVDAMPKGGKIVVTSSKVRFENLRDEFVEISVQDEGVGIPSSHLEKIFDWDFSTKAKTEKGLGWGLGWVKTFVERSNGRISVESEGEEGKGSIFTLRFPVAGDQGGGK